MPPDGDVAHHTILAEKPRQSRAPNPARLLGSARPSLPSRSTDVLHSIEALAREVRVCSDLHENVHGTSPEAKYPSRDYDRREAGLDQMYRREDALNDLIALMPAQNLTDAVVQLGLMMTVLDAHDRGPRDDLSQLDAREIELIHADIRKVARLAVSVLHAVMAKAEVEPVELLSEWHLNQWDIRFGAVVQATRGAA